MSNDKQNTVSKVVQDKSFFGKVVHAITIGTQEQEKKEVRCMMQDTKSVQTIRDKYRNK